MHYNIDAAIRNTRCYSISIFHLRYSETIFLSARKRSFLCPYQRTSDDLPFLKSNQTARDKLLSRERNDKLERLFGIPRGYFDFTVNSNGIALILLNIFGHTTYFFYDYSLIYRIL